MIPLLVLSTEKTFAKQSLGKMFKIVLKIGPLYPQSAFTLGKGVGRGAKVYWVKQTVGESQSH